MLIGYSLHSRLLMNDRSVDTMIEQYLSKSVDDVHNTDKRALSAIAFFLKQVARREQYLDRVKSIIAQLKTSESISAQWVAEEVNTFVEYSL